MEDPPPVVAYESGPRFYDFIVSNNKKHLSYDRHCDSYSCGLLFFILLLALMWFCHCCFGFTFGTRPFQSITVTNFKQRNLTFQHSHQDALTKHNMREWELTFIPICSFRILCDILSTEPILSPNVWTYSPIMVYSGLLFFSM